MKKNYIILLLLIQFQGCDWFLNGCGSGRSAFGDFNAVDTIDLNTENIHVKFYQFEHFAENSIAFIEKENPNLSSGTVLFSAYVKGYSYKSQNWRDSVFLNDTLHIWYSPIDDSSRTSTYVPSRFRKMACSPIPHHVIIDSVVIESRAFNTISYSQEIIGY